ncbi:MAG: aminotransferase class V-fold PLP-dependent enzyme [Clostridium sp.]
MKQTYLDNASTTFPKAPQVATSVYEYLTSLGCNINRGAYSNSFKAESVVFETRELICKLFNFHTPENVVFTKNITEGLNIILKGLLKPSDEIIISSMEHNAVTRPLNSLVLNNIKIHRVTCSSKGELNPKDILKFINKNTKALLMTAASNVCGTILPLKEIGAICKDNNIIFILDSAQGAGVISIDYEDINASIIAFTGHKGLLGPQGIGGFLISDSIVNLVNPLIEGGTGSVSESEIQPNYMPDKFESGTPNVPGIFGLNSSLKFILDEGIHNIHNKEISLTKKFIEGISLIKEAKIIGLPSTKNRVAVVSLDFSPLDNALISHYLEKNHGIMTRCGLHCAPSAHKTLGTFPNGTVRFSFGYFNTLQDVTTAITAITEVLKLDLL